MEVRDLMADLKREVVSEPSKRVLAEIFSALDIELRFCKLEGCGRPFVAKKKNHGYCSKAHGDADWNYKRR